MTDKSTYQAVHTTAWIEEKNVFTVSFGDVTMYNKGGTDFQLFYNLPSGGMDQAVLGLGRCRIKMQAENRSMVMSFYAAQCNGSLTGHVLVKNQRIAPGKEAHYNLTPQQVAMAQMQRVQGRRIYLGVLRLGYTSATDVTGSPVDSDVAMTLQVTMQVRIRGRHQARPNDCFLLTALQKGKCFDETTMNNFMHSIDADNMVINTAAAPAAGVPFWGSVALKGAALAHLDTDDKDSTYGGLSWSNFLQVNVGALFILGEPVVLQCYDASGALVVGGYFSFQQVLVGVDASNTARAFFYDFDYKNKVARGGSTATPGVAAGNSQVEMCRAKMVLPTFGGAWVATVVSDSYTEVFDVRRKGVGKKKKGGKQQPAKLTVAPVKRGDSLSKHISSRYFFPKVANMQVADLFLDNTSISRGGATQTYKSPDNKETKVLEDVLESY